MKLIHSLFFLGSLAFIPAQSYAQELHGLAMHGLAMHGLAMHGAPKYAADFTHLDYVDPAAPKGGTLRQGVTGSFDSLHPYIYKGTPAAGGHLIHESLLARVWDEPFSLYGLLAKTVDVAPDRAWVSFTLRDEARWHDGTPVTVDDVIFSFKTLRDKGKPNHRRMYSKVASIERVGDNGVRFHFIREEGEIDQEMPLIMGVMPILNKQWWEEHDFSQTTLDIPLASGPYRVKEVDAPRRVVYERDPDYWGKDLPVNKGLYNFDQVIFDYYRDAGVALEAFKAGELDIRREFDATRWQVAYDFPAVQKGDVILDEIAHSRPERARGLIFNTRRDIFKDLKVRQALSHALDFEWMNKNLFRSSFKRNTSYFPNSELAAKALPQGEELEILEKYKEKLPPGLFNKPFSLPKTDGSGPRGMRANLRKAGKLLDEAGWSVVDGKRVNNQGDPLVFEILLVDSKDEKIALEFSRMCEKLGVDVKIRTVESAQFQERLNSFDYDMVMYRWVSSLSPGNEQLYYWGSKAADQPGSRNYAGVKNDVVDEIAASIASAPSREDLVARARALDRVLLWGYYSIPLYHIGKDYVAYRADVKRPNQTPIYGMVIEAWWSENNEVGQ